LDGRRLIEPSEAVVVALPEQNPPPSLWRVFKLWVLIGGQSFGGGVATLALIRQTAVVNEGWLTDEQYISDWALCQITPGINLLAIAILIGRRTNGFRGAIVAMFGLLGPSAALTIAMTAIYRDFQSSPITQRILSGLIPATIGLGLVTSYGMGKPLLENGTKKGLILASICVLLLIASGVVMLLKNAPTVIEILVGAGLILGLAYLLHARRVTTE
jgi:chromate transporter